MPDSASMYDDATDSAAAPTETPSASPDDATDEEGATALLPKSFFPDPPEVGKHCTIETVRVHDDQVEVKYVPEGEEESGEETAPPEAAAEPAGGPAGMME